jgi:exopolyphosphatase/guanosine-5'-triphosphate,3'-diphosphate pyrophosphatase
LRIEILSEIEEARLGYVAAVNTSTLRDGVVLELGGGSLQLIRVTNRRAVELGSLPLGAVRLTEELLPDSRPARKKELERVRARIRETLDEVGWLSGSGERLVGIGGAVRNLASAAQHATDQDEFGVQGYVLTQAALGELVKQLATLEPEERGAVPGIKPGRPDDRRRARVRRV